MIDASAMSASAPVRSPKTAELVAGTLRRMVVDGQLKDGDFLPNEAELMAHFGVSRPTLREAVRVLESERLVEVRRGSRTGARVPASYVRSQAEGRESFTVTRRRRISLWWKSTTQRGSPKPRGFVALAFTSGCGSWKPIYDGTQMIMSLPKVKLVSAACIVTLLLSILDINVVAAVAWNMVGDLDPIHGIDKLPWLTSCYALADCIVVPLLGKLADEYGSKLMLVISLGIFAAGSLGCAVSTVCSEAIFTIASGVAVRMRVPVEAR